MKIKSLIIDDNPFIIDLLTDLLEQAHSEVEVLDSAKSGQEALIKIKNIQPDLIFLDVEMPDMTGFEMLARLEEISFQTIFITSHSHYAIKAIRFNALDYLVKPIDPKELKQAIRRYQSDKRNLEQIEQALENLKTDNVEDQRLLLQTQEGELRLQLKSIIKIEGERNYSYLYLSNGSKKLSSKTLGFFEEILSEKGFFRCHRSFLINGSHTLSINKNAFLLKDQSSVPVSRRKKAEAKLWFSNLR